MKIISTMVLTLCFSSMMFASDNGMSSSSKITPRSAQSKKFRHKREMPYLRLPASLAELDQQEEEQRILELDWNICKTVIGFTLLSFAINPFLITKEQSNSCKN